MKVKLPREVIIPDNTPIVQLVAKLNDALGLELESVNGYSDEVEFKSGTRVVRQFPRNVIVRQPPDPSGTAA